MKRDSEASFVQHVSYNQFLDMRILPMHDTCSSIDAAYMHRLCICLTCCLLAMMAVANRPRECWSGDGILLRVAGSYHCHKLYGITVSYNLAALVVIT